MKSGTIEIETEIALDELFEKAYEQQREKIMEGNYHCGNCGFNPCACLGQPKPDEPFVIGIRPSDIQNMAECVAMELVQKDITLDIDEIMPVIAYALEEWFKVAGEKPDGPGYDGKRYD